MGLLSVFEDRVESFMGGIFRASSHFRIDDLAVAVCRSAERCKRGKRGQARLPQKYEIRFNEAAWDRIDGNEPAIRAQIVESLENMARTRGYFYEAPFEIAFKRGSELQRPFLIDARHGPDEKPFCREGGGEAFIAGVLLVNGRRYLVAHPDVPDELLPVWVMKKQTRLKAKTVSIGREGGTGGPFDMELDDRAVSGRRPHAMLAVGRQAITIADNHSSNGLKVNSHKTGRKSLEHGDKIQVGRTVITFERLVCRRPEEPDDKTYILSPGESQVK